MGLLNLASATAYARTSVSQANIGTATTLALVLPISGADLLSVSASGGGFVTVFGASSRFQAFAATVGTDLYLGVIPGSGTTGQTFGIIPRASISVGAQYRIYMDAGPGGRLVELYTAAGALVGSGSAGSVTLANNGASNGQVQVGENPFGGFSAVSAAYDGIAIYSARQTGAARYSQPDPDAPGLLWCVLDDAGNIVSGATDLDVLSDAVWGPGGEWNRPAAPIYTGAIAASAQSATASLSGSASVPSYAGTLAAAAGVAIAAFAGLYVAPTGGALSARAESAASSFSGAYEAPITGALAAQGQAAIAAFSGSHSFDGLRLISLGESQFDEYRSDDERITGPLARYVLNPIEQLAGADLGQPFPAMHTRGIDIGSWSATSRGEPRRRGFARNLARSGNQMSQVVANQLPLAITMANDADFAVLMCTGNEWGNPGQTPYLIDWIYHGTGTLDRHGVAVTARMNTVFGQVDAVMTDLAPELPAGLVVITPPMYGQMPLLRAGFPDATRRGYVDAAISYLNNLLYARANAINTALGRTAVIVQDWDELFLPVWETDTGTHVTIAGVPLDYTANSEDGSPYYFNIAAQTAIPHLGTVGSGLLANTIIHGLNQLPGVSIAPFTDREIRENAGIFADEVEGDLAVGAASATAALAGTHTAPTYAGALATEASHAAASLAGAATLPVYAGALAAESDPATAALAGSASLPQETGEMRALAQAAGATFAGAHVAPAYAGEVAAGAEAATVALAGAYALPTEAGTLRATAAQATASLAGDYSAPAHDGALTAATQPATASFGGAHAAPIWAGEVAAQAERAVATLAGRYADPGVIVGRLRPSAGYATAAISGGYVPGGDVVIHPDNYFVFRGAPTRTFTFQRS